MALADRRSDEAIMAAVRAGDLEAVSALFERHHRRLYGLLVCLVGEPATAEDLVQETFLRLLRYRRSYRLGAPFAPWLVQIARRCAWSSRRAPVHTPLEDAPEIGLDAEQIDRQLVRERAEVVRSVLGTLPSAAREVLLLSRYRGLDHRQIGELLGVRPGTVRVRVHRAMAALRQALTERDEGGERR